METFWDMTVGALVVELSYRLEWGPAFLSEGLESKQPF